MGNLKYAATLSLVMLTLLGVGCGATTAAKSTAAPAQGTAKTTAGTAVKLGTPPGFKPLAERTGAVSKVYFTRDISAAGLKKIYSRINQDLSGKIAVKLHTGEPHGPNILDRGIVKDFLAGVPGSTIVECNVLYNSPRRTTAGHRETLKTNGWTFSPVDIMDEDGAVMLPIKGGKQLQEVSVGKHELNYDSMLVLTHFKGHTMGGFGGSIKNIGIGCADGKIGKLMVHGEGWPMGESFMERMVESAKGTVDHFGKKIAFIDVMNKMSVDCDCAGTSAENPKLKDIGILGSTDIVAVDQAAIDLVYGVSGEESHDLKERIESRKGLRQLTYGKELGLGHDKYELVDLDKE